MARSTKDQLQLLVDKYQPQVRSAFMNCIRTLRRQIPLKSVAARLERGDLIGAIMALKLEPEAFTQVQLAIEAAYNASGQLAVENMPRIADPDGGTVLFRWGVRNLTAENELRTHAAKLVVEITNDQRLGIREMLSEGLAHGDNPWVTARRIVGDRDGSGGRTGGVLGLTSRQTRTVTWVRRAFIQGNVEKMREYLELKLRDKRFDRSIVKAINSGRPLAREAADKIANQYANRALDYRGRVMARNETFIALGIGRDDAFAQQIAAGKLLAEDVTKTWRHTRRDNPRWQHIKMAGKDVPLDEPFIMPDGTRIRYPHDPKAPANHTIGCFCRIDYKIDHFASVVRRFGAAA